jgi:hypothetical protein
MCFLAEVINPLTRVNLGSSGLASLDMVNCVECQYSNYNVIYQYSIVLH